MSTELLFQDASQPASATFERLPQSETVREVWSTMERLSVLNPTESGRRTAFYEVVQVTPLLKVPDSALPQDLQGSDYRLLVKHDGRQRGGAYKLRGATNALLDIRENSPEVHTVNVASTGNHANEVAIAAGELGFDRVVVQCLKGVSPVKLHGMRSNGAEVNDTHRDLSLALKSAEAKGRQPGHAFVHPFDQMNVVAAQGTCALETMAQLQAMGTDPNSVDFEYPGGGGGMAAGNAVAIKMHAPDAHVGVSQMVGAAGIVKTLKGEFINPRTLDKACDGAAVAVPGVLPMKILSELLDTAVEVTKAEIGEAMAVLARVHEVPEPAGALAMAKALKKMREAPLKDWSEHRTIVTVTSGINVTQEKVSEFMSAALDVGMLTPGEAFTTLSKAYSERTITGVDEIALRTSYASGIGSLAVLSGSFPR